MDQDLDLFVQAFWVKCREVIRPEIEARIGDLRGAGHDANVSTHEYSEAADRLPTPIGPSVTLTLRPVDATGNTAPARIEFHGDVRRQAVDVLTDGACTRSYELAALGTAEVKAELDQWLARRAAAPSV